MSTVSPADQGVLVLGALAGQPGGEAVLGLAAQRADLMLVGGAVRDLLLGRTPLELDLTVANGAAETAAALADGLAGPPTALPPRVVTFDRFGTASVEWEGGRIDIAGRRRETYPEPGALPEVVPGSLQEDLGRRDFTVNAIALPLSGPDAGRLQAIEHGLEDLSAGRLRVLHERSFLDDPTRLLRLARYSARLGFEVERTTAELARQALADRVLQSISPARVGAELWLALSEEEPLGSLLALEQLGILPALGFQVPFDVEQAEAALALLPSDGNPPELLMAMLLRSQDASDSDRTAASELLNGFEVQADARERILAGAFTAEAMADRLHPDLGPSDLRGVFGQAPVEAIALAGALAQRRSPETVPAAKLWLDQLRHVRLRIGGDDLLAAGIEQGPEVGERLARTLDMKLDGEIADSAEAEMQAALEASP